MRSRQVDRKVIYTELLLDAHPKYESDFEIDFELNLISKNL